MFQLGVRIGEGVALEFSDIEYGKIAIQRMEEKEQEKLMQIRCTYPRNKKSLENQGIS